MKRSSVAVLVCPARGVLLLRTTKDTAFYLAGTWECLRDVRKPSEFFNHTFDRVVLERTGFDTGGVAPTMRNELQFGDTAMLYSALTVPADWNPVLSDEHDAWAWWVPSMARQLCPCSANVGFRGNIWISPVMGIAFPDISFIWAAWHLLGVASA